MNKTIYRAVKEMAYVLKSGVVVFGVLVVLILGAVGGSWGDAQAQGTIPTRPPSETPVDTSEPPPPTETPIIIIPSPTSSPTLTASPTASLTPEPSATAQPPTATETDRLTETASPMKVSPVTPASSPTPPMEASSRGGSGWLWWGLTGLIVVGVVAWLRRRRRHGI